jgi:hypothetical protein
MRRRFFCTALLAVGSAVPAVAHPPGWRFVDRGWVKPDRTVRLSQLLELTEEDGRHVLVSKIAPSLEPMLANWRTAVVEIEGNPFVWKASVQGRVWNFNRSAATQHLQLIASVQDTPMPPAFTLTKIEITPQVRSLQASAVVDSKPVSVIVVMTPQFTELAVSALGEAKANVIVRSSSARDMLRESPVAARKYLIPALKLVTGGQNPLHPGAAEVYRAFDFPPDPTVTAAIKTLLPRLASADAAEREQASTDLTALGRRGVQAAMGIDLDTLHPEAATRLQALIARETHDTRPAAALRADLTFVIDAARDPDPFVRAAAEELMRSPITPNPKQP